MDTSTPTRRWYAKRMTYRRYQVTCRHSNGVEQDCGITLPECSQDQLLEWLLEHMLPQEPLLINEGLEMAS